MTTMKTTVILILYSQILFWNLKTSFYQLLELPNTLLFLVKMTLSESLLHIQFDATKLKFHLPKTGSISRALWTYTPTTIPRVGLGEVSSKSVMSLDDPLAHSPTHNPKKTLSYVQRHSSSFPSCIFLCLYFKLYSLANLHPLTRHIKHLFFLYTFLSSSHRIALYHLFSTVNFFF